MIKVTVTHYLNKKLKPSLGVGLYTNEFAYPVYIRISFGRKNLRIKSRWIHFDVSEKEFETDKRIQEVKEYEASIICDAFKYQNSDDFDISTKLQLYLEDISKHYVGWVILKDEVTSCIINYICEKANINGHILYPYINYREILDYSSDDWYELIDRRVFLAPLADKILYFAMLAEFKSINYKDDTSDYEVGKILNYYEWKNKGGKERFLQFAVKKQLLENTKITEITNLFDEMLKQKIHDNWLVMEEDIRNSKKKKY